MRTSEVVTPSRPKHQHKIILFVLCVAYGALQVVPAYQKVFSSKQGRDFSTFYYAQKVLRFDGDPYHTRSLSKMAKKERTRSSVHPFFYPPPSLFLFSWASYFPLHTSYKIFFFINQLASVALFWVLYRWLKISVLTLGLLFLACTPLGDCIMMGQVNILILLMISLAFYKNNAPLLSMAAMIKMSPALLLWPKIIWKQWFFVLITGVAALLYSIFMLPWLDLQEQLRFYTEILPQFSSGQYSDLKVPIHLSSNHSIPELCNQIWPNESPKTLSSAAKTASNLINLSLLGILSWRAYTCTRHIEIIGATIVLMVLVPVYTYEHHLVFLLLPTAIIWSNPPKGIAKLLAGLMTFFLFWPLSWWKYSQKALPEMQWLIQESKFLAALCLFFALCFWHPPKTSSTSKPLQRP